MPGGNDFRKWYAMRKAMQERGTWTGKKPPPHKVPALDLQSGEPAPKIPREGPLFGRITEPSPDTSPGSAIAPSSAETVPDSNPPTPDSLPELEPPYTAEGNRHVYLTWF